MGWTLAQRGLVATRLSKIGWRSVAAYLCKHLYRRKGVGSHIGFFELRVNFPASGRIEPVVGFAAHVTRFEADFLEESNHEILADDDMLTTPFSRPIAEELSLGSITDLASAVRDCRDLIADIDLALRRP